MWPGPRAGEIRRWGQCVVRVFHVSLCQLPISALLRLLCSPFIILGWRVAGDWDEARKGDAHVAWEHVSESSCPSWANGRLTTCKYLDSGFSLNLLHV